MAVLMFIIGAILGSFFLVIGTRLPKGEDAFFSRSKCDYCNHTLKWYNLIPIFSYAITNNLALNKSFHFLYNRYREGEEK